jgi:uncharacterized repeat protein (TIGR02543 family)
MILRSFAMNADGTFDRASAKVWTSSIKSGGGTQSTPVIWNDRLYIGGGGSTLGSNEPFTVINIAWNGTMTTAYTVDELKTKGTASLTTAYSTADNGYAVYIYLIEYGKVLPGEAFDSPIGSADIFVLRDSVGQNNKDIVFKMTPSVPQFAYQSFSISSDGYLLVRNDSTLFCYGFGTPGVHTHADVSDEIDRIIKMAENVNVSSADVGRAESRYASLSDPDKSEVSNYSELQDLYRSVTFTAGSDSVEKRYLKGSLLSAPNLKISDGKFITGWTSGGSYWNFNTGTVENDMTLTAVFDDAAVVSFDSAGGSPVRSIYVEKGSEMGYLKDPERDGYTFGGWKAGGTEYVPQHSLVSGDVKLTAVWLKNSTISFDSDGGSQAKSIYVTYSKRIDTLPTVSKSGYAFTGWYYGDVLYTSETVYGLQNDITLKAGWSKNATSSLDNGKGIVVTGTIPAGASLSVVKPFSGSTSISEIKKASGNQNMDFVMITVAGDGVDGSQEFSVELPAGAGSNGKSLDVYYYKTSGVSKVTGTVSDGVLKVSIYGDTGGGGVQIVLGTADGTEIADYI